MSVAVEPFSYSERNKTPNGYVCSCGANGVRLYREYNTFLDNQSLSCRACSIERYNKNHTDKWEPSHPEDKESAIGWVVAAVPTEDGETYWGYTSVPQDGCDWWYALPKGN